MTNTPIIIAGPCAVTYQGSHFLSEGGVKLNINENTAAIPTDAHGLAALVNASTDVTLSFKPTGTVAEIVAVMAEISSRTPGQSVIPGGTEAAKTVTSGDETANTVTVTSHGFSNDDRIVFLTLSGGSGITAATVVYRVGDVTTNTFKIYDQDSGTVVDFSTAITGGTVARLKEEELVITPLYEDANARTWRFRRAGITGLPSFVAAAGKTAFGGELTFTVLPSAVQSATPVYTTVAWSAAPAHLYDAADVPVLPCKAVWADNHASLSSGDATFYSVDGWTLTPNYTVTKKTAECALGGVADVLFADMRPEITGTVAQAEDYQGTRLKEHEILALGSPALGARLPGQKAAGKTLWLKMLSGDGLGGVAFGAGTPIFQVYNTTIQMLGFNWSGSEHRTGQVKFTARPVFSSGARTFPMIQQLD